VLSTFRMLGGCCVEDRFDAGDQERGAEMSAT
jgi:hypothetical protein